MLGGTGFQGITGEGMVGGDSGSKADGHSDVASCLKDLGVGVMAQQKNKWPLPVLLSGKKLPHQPSSCSQIIQFLPICPWP